MAQGFLRSAVKTKGSRKFSKITSSSSKPAKSKSWEKRGGKPGMKKGTFAIAPKKASLIKEHKKQQSLTKVINQEIIGCVSAKALRGLEKVENSEIKGEGKKRVREVNRERLTRKKSRVEQKLIEAKMKNPNDEDSS